MIITINGDVYITNYGQTLDEVVGEGLPVYQFEDEDDGFEKGRPSWHFEDDCDIEEFIEDCDECGFCDLDCDDCELDDEDDLDDNVDALLEMYADILDESCGCLECTKEILLDLIKDFVDILVE